MNGRNRRPTCEGVRQAAERLKGFVTVTPLLPLTVGRATGWLKAESLQLGGSFKIRGAYNRLAQVPVSDRARGVVAFSSGNHAQGVARAAALLEMPATIVMPSDAPRVKRDGTMALGAEIVAYDRRTENREAIAATLAAARGSVLVPSFDDVDVIEGQGSTGIEAMHQADRAIQRVVICCGGGGLSAGIALALPDAEIVVVEPEGWDDMGRSLALGEIVPVGPSPPRTACDALQTMRVSPLTFDVLKERRAHGMAVSEAEVRTAMRFAYAMGLVVEPGGAVALAAVLSGRAAFDAGTMVVVSGGNVDPLMFARVIGAEVDA